MAEAKEVIDEDEDYALCQSIRLGKDGGGGRRTKLPHEKIKTGSVNLTIGKWRRLPM